MASYFVNTFHFFFCYSRRPNFRPIGLESARMWLRLTGRIDRDRYLFVPHLNFACAGPWHVRSRVRASCVRECVHMCDSCSLFSVCMALECLPETRPGIDRWRRQKHTHTYTLDSEPKTLIVRRLWRSSDLTYRQFWILSLRQLPIVINSKHSFLHPSHCRVNIPFQTPSAIAIKRYCFTNTHTYTHP